MPSRQTSNRDSHTIDEENEEIDIEIGDEIETENEEQAHAHLISQDSISMGPPMKKAKKLTSPAWETFERITEVVNGSVMVKAKCKHCKKIYNGSTSRFGIGTLLRHANSCKEKKKIIDTTTQPILHFDKDGKLTPFRYVPKRWRESLVRLISREDSPISFGESSSYEMHVQESFNPSFQTISARTIRREIKEYFVKHMSALRSDLSKMDCCVALTSNIWDSRAHLDYCSVVSHYIDNSWTLQKRIIGFRLVHRHTGSTIADSVLLVLQDYELQRRTISVTFDNASANSKAIEFMKHPLEDYNGGVLLHQRCACHVINLIVKSSLKALKQYVEKVRDIVSYIRMSSQRVNAFKNECRRSGGKVKILEPDMPTQWNSTYIMLKKASEFKSVIGQYLMKLQMEASSDSPTTLNRAEWDVIDKITKFLQVFYEATTTLSGSYYTTSPKALHQLAKIVHTLFLHKNDPHISVGVAAMRKKYLKYWATPPLLYSLAWILDPRAKMVAFKVAVDKMRAWLDIIDEKDFPKEVENYLYALFNKYEDKFGCLRVRTQETSDETSNAWNILDFSPSSFLMDEGADGQYFELKNYLDSRFVTSNVEDKDNLNLLHWWESHKAEYPVLFRLAKDVYTIPASTVSSESAFSMVGRIVEERRANLKPETIEMLTLIKNWELQDQRVKGLDMGLLEAYFEDDTDDEEDSSSSTLVS